MNASVVVIDPSWFAINMLCLCFLGIIQSTSFSNQSKLEGISKSNLETLNNLKKQVLDVDTEHAMTVPGDDDEDEDEADDNELVKYLMCLWRNLDSDQGSVGKI